MPVFVITYCVSVSLLQSCHDCCDDLCALATLPPLSFLVQGEGAAASLPPTLDPTMMEAQGFDHDGMLRLVGKSVPASQTLGVVPALFWAAGFSFSRAQLMLEVMLVMHTACRSLIKFHNGNSVTLCKVVWTLFPLLARLSSYLACKIIPADGYCC